MSGQPNPVKMVEAFGINAVAPYITKPIPVPSQIPGGNPGNASLNDGFPPLTMTPLADGGIPPSGADMNGILYEMSTTIAANNAGQVFNVYDATYQTAIGGYNKGAVLLQAANKLAYWISTVDANVTNPDTGGAGWLSSTALYSTTITITAGSHDNVVLPGPSDYVLDVSTAAGAITYTGFVAQRDGQRIVFTNTNVGLLTFAALTGSTSGNQLRLPSDLSIVQNQSITLQYSTGAGKWVVA